MSAAAGQRVGPYEILGRLGSGGMGLVYSAWDARLHRDVAIKLLREEFISGDSRERFLMEARAASGLNHPNICTIFDIGEQDGNPYLVMELLKGETLRARISSGVVPPEQILSVGMEIADALAAAHARGIIHRDIKPANIFMVARPGGGWQSKVLDFGLAKVDVGESLDPRFRMTGIGSTVGTVAYMSPEQARGEALDARSDLFALGIVLYEMATRHVPFDGLTSALIFVKLLGQPPAPVRKFNPGFPRAIERIVLKLLAKEPGARFQSATELCDALRTIELKAGATTPRPGWFGGTRRSSGPRPQPSRLPAPLHPPAPAAEDLGAARVASKQPVVIHPVRRTTSTNQQTFGVPADDQSSAEGPSARSLLGPDSTTQGHSSRQNSRRSRAPAGRPASFGFALSTVTEPQPAGVGASVPAESVEEEVPRRRLWPLAVLLLAATVAGFIYLGPRPLGTGSTSPQTVLVASVVNHSGEDSLEAVILEGLRIELRQSSRLGVADGAATTAAGQAAGLSASAPWTVADARSAAKAIEARTFLVGEISRSAGSYVLEATLYNTSGGSAVFHAEATAEDRSAIPAALDKVGSQVRTAMGEPDRSQAMYTLARHAGVEALELYTTGLAADAAGRPLEALLSFQRAVAVDARFSEAWMRLARLYADQRADLAAADAATRAREAAAGSSDRDRMLAEAAFDIYTSADYPQALRVLDRAAAAYPLDLGVAGDRALVLRLQGRYTEAYEAAHIVLAANSFDGRAAHEAVYALLALDRIDAARQLEDQAARHGQHHPDLHVLLNYVSDPDAPIADTEPDQLRAQAYRAQLLDATGQFTAGLNAWRSAAATAQSNPALASAAAYMLAQAALDLALVGDCAASASVGSNAGGLPRGQDAIFALGMANALCGDLSGERSAVLALMAQYAQSFAVKGYLLPNLTAIDQIRTGDIDAAIATLEPLKEKGASPMSTYLRALASSTGKQWPGAIGDYQNLLQRRGSSLLTNPTMYAMAQFNLARAQAAGFNPQGAAASYAQFLQMWKPADPGNALVTEARKHATYASAGLF